MNVLFLTMAKDIYHDALVTALEKDGWTIIKENYLLGIDDEISYFIDVFAEKYVIAARETQWIVVEVKSFRGISKTYEFHSAIGQYVVYHTALEYLKIKKQLYLAVPIETYNTLFQKKFIRHLVWKYNIQLMPFDPQEKILIP